MYEKVRAMQSLAKQYSELLVDQSVMTQEEVDRLRAEINQHFESEFEKSKSFKPDILKTKDARYKGSRAFTHKWEGIDFSQNGKEPENTGYDSETLKEIGLSSVRRPADFNVHPRLQKMHIANRVKGIENDAFDWAAAEAMALGSLNREGFNTRLIGEDSERGTFSQRHAVYTDQKNFGVTYCPLAQGLTEEMGRF